MQVVTISSVSTELFHYDPRTGELMELTPRQLPRFHTFRLLEDGQIAMTRFGPNEPGAELLITYGIEIPKIHNSGLEMLMLTDPDLAEALPEMTDNMRLPSAMRTRIMTAYKEFVVGKDTSFDECAEACTLLHFAPFDHPDSQIVKGKTRYLSDDMVRDVMNSYHRLPGVPPPVHYEVAIPVD